MYGYCIPVTLQPLFVVTKMPLWSHAAPYKHVRKLVCLRKKKSGGGGGGGGGDGRAEADEDDGFTFEVEPPRAKTPADLVKKWLAFDHIGQWDPSNHTKYCGAVFPSDPFGGTKS